MVGLAETGDSLWDSHMPPANIRVMAMPAADCQ